MRPDKAPVRRTAVPPIQLKSLFDSCDKQITSYSEICGVPAYTIPRSWLSIALAEAMSKSGLNLLLDPDPYLGASHLRGRKAAIPDPDTLPPLDFLAWSEWSRHAPEPDEFGRDERKLPPIYVARFAFHHLPTIKNKPYGDMWDEMASFAKVIKGPLTASLIVINRTSGLEAWSVAQNFKYATEKKGATSEVSTQVIDVLGPTVFEPLERFQILIASRQWHRKPIPNPLYKPPRRGSR